MSLGSRGAGPIERIGPNIRAEREHQEWTQADLAKALGTSALVVAHLEAGRQVPSLRRLCALADALGCDAGELLE